MAIFKRNKRALTPYESQWVDGNPYNPSRFAGTFSGVTVNERSALQSPTYNACLNAIADDIASFTLHPEYKGLRTDKRYRLLERPNPLETRYETMKRMVYSLLANGNAIALLGDYTLLGYPQMYVPVHCGDVYIDPAGGRVRYRISQNGKAQSLDLDASEVLHVRFGPLLPGEYMGKGLLETGKEVIAYDLALQEYGARFYAEGAVPDVILKPHEPQKGQPFGADTMQQIKEDYLLKKAGRNRMPIVTPPGYDVQVNEFEPEKAQYVQAREFSAQQVANLFRFPHHRLGLPGSQMTYQNVEQANLEYVKHTLRPLMRALELSLSDLLPNGTEARFDFGALLRVDTKTQYEALRIANPTEIMLTQDEVRELLGREPLPKNETTGPRPDENEDIEDET